MIERSDLETPRTHKQMAKLLRPYEEDRIAYPQNDIFMRKGIIKVLLEEYYPLFDYLASFPEGSTGRLTEKSLEGADAVIKTPDNVEHRIQITVADQSYQAALSREKLCEDKFVFQHTEKRKNHITKKVEDIPRPNGLPARVLASPKGVLRQQVDAILDKVEAKCKKFHKDTDTLLVSAHIYLNDAELDYSWKKDLEEKFCSITKMPYKKVYLRNKKELIPLKEGLPDKKKKTKNKKCS